MITLNNPGKLNALTEEMGYQLTATVEELQGKKELRAAILTGDSEIMRQQDWDSYQGAGKAFSAGGDLAWLMERHRDTAENNIRVMQVLVLVQVFNLNLVLASLSPIKPLKGVLQEVPCDARSTCACDRCNQWTCREL